MTRLLVLGAGAAIEECIRSGNSPHDAEWLFPSMKNFCNKLFVVDSNVLMRVTASYLQANNIHFSEKMLNLRVGSKFKGRDIDKSPIGIFKKLEMEKSDVHNIEKLCEYAWNIFGKEPQFWQAFTYDGIYFHLFALFSQQFGLGIGKPMIAGTKVAAQLNPGDVVINLNYDIAFDLALKQINKLICYAPRVDSNSILLLKPHGSMNFYINFENDVLHIEQPDQIYGSVSVDFGDGIYHPYGTIIPPRLNKNYEAHPRSKMILQTGRPFSPKIVTFWGVGLTESDTDLISIYKEASNTAEKIEFINPDYAAYKKASQLLEKEIMWFETLGGWLSKYGISYP